MGSNQLAVISQRRSDSRERLVGSWSVVDPTKNLIGRVGVARLILSRGVQVCRIEIGVRFAVFAERFEDLAGTGVCVEAVNL